MIEKLPLTRQSKSIIIPETTMLCRTSKTAMLLALIFATDTAFADPENTYLEADGIVLFNVEDAEPVGDWELRTDLEDFNGAGYLEWRGGNFFQSGAAGEGTITYHFRIATAGNYQFRFRSHIAEGESNTEHNDSWIRLATGVNIPDEHPLDGWTKVYMNTSGQWAWASKTVDFVGLPIRQYFAEGDHTIELSGRSRGHAVDMIALYKYDEVNYNARAVSTWELSEVVSSDGTLVIPGEYPEPEEPEIEVVEAPEPVNLDIADASWTEIADNVCTGDTLALPAIDSAFFNPADPVSSYTTEDEILIVADSTAALLKFDLALVPRFDSLILEYSTTVPAENATLDYSLASHSLWGSLSDAEQSDQPPHTMLQLGTASGGWLEDTRHRSSLSPILINSGINTILMQAQPGSDTVGIYSHTEPDLAPRLLITGDENFCSNLQANRDAVVVVEEVEVVEEMEEVEEVEEVETVDEEAESEVELVERNEVEAKPETQSRIGSSSLIGLLLLIMINVKRLILHRHRLARG